MAVTPTPKICIALVGSENAGRLLHDICTQLQRRPYLHKGQPFVARSRKEWCERLGFTHWQFVKALRKLTDLGLVRSEIHLLRGRTAGFLTLTDEAESVFKRQIKHMMKGGMGSTVAPRETRKRATPGAAPKATPGATPQATPTTVHIIKEANASYKDKDSYSSLVHLPMHDPSQGEESGKKVLGKKGNTKGSEIKEDHVTKASGKPGTKDSLVLRWMTLVSEHHKTFVPPLSLKQAGQLTDILNKVPEELHDGFFETIIAKWTGFTDYASKVGGLWKFPEQPSIGFLLSQVGPAVNYVMKKQEAKKNPKKGLGSLKDLL